MWNFRLCYIALLFYHCVHLMKKHYVLLTVCAFQPVEMCYRLENKYIYFE